MRRPSGSTPETWARRAQLANLPAPADAAQVQTQPELPIEVRRAVEPGRQGLPKPATDILQLLGGGRELSSSDIAEALTLPGSTTRYWLRRLREQRRIEPTVPNLRSPYLKYRLAR